MNILPVPRVIGTDRDVGLYLVRRSRLAESRVRILIQENMNMGMSQCRIALVLVIVLSAAGLMSCKEVPPTEPPTVAKPQVDPTMLPESQLSDAWTTVVPPEPTLAATREAPGNGSPAEVLVAKLHGLGLDDFFEVSFRELMLRDPESVVEEGLVDLYRLAGAELTDISDAYIRETYEMQMAVLDMLRTYDRDELGQDQQISYDVYEWYLEDLVDEQDFVYHEYPSTFFFITSVPEGLVKFFSDLHPLEDRQDAEDYVTRLTKVEPKLDQLLEGLRWREEKGIVPPRFVTEWTLYGLRNLAESPARSAPFYAAFKEKIGPLQDIDDAEKQALLASAEKAIEESVLPAYRSLVDYLEHREPIMRRGVGVGQLPDGDAYYEYALRHHTTTGMTAEEIHQLGLREIDRIHAEMRAIFDELGYPQNETLPELYDRVAKDGGHVSGNDVVTAYEDLIASADASLDGVFDVRPEAQVAVIADEHGGYYVSPSYDGSRPGAFYAGVSGRGEDRYGMPTLAYHEAIPGHHWQIAIAQEAGLPSFRMGASFTGYTEGWALYAERLAWESGWYKDDPYGDLGRLQAEAFRAARLVIDPGIHAMGWNFDRAVDYMTENVGYEVGDIVNPEYEVARYVVWPGQATAYKIGMLKILELRQMAMDRLGEGFDLKEFHNVVLSNGSMPLEILERVVLDYIEAKLSQGA